EVARVALALLGRQLAGLVDRVAAVLPQRDAAGHRLDVGVAEVGQRLGGERGARAGRAVDDDALVAVGDRAVDAGLEVAARDVRRAGQVAGVPLLGLAHVEQGDALVEQLADLAGVHLGDLLLDGADVVGAAGAHTVKSYRGSGASESIASRPRRSRAGGRPLRPGYPPAQSPHAGQPALAVAGAQPLEVRDLGVGQDEEAPVAK